MDSILRIIKCLGIWNNPDIMYNNNMSYLDNNNKN